MDRFTFGEEGLFSHRRAALAWHLLCVALVTAYASSFAVWSWLGQWVGRETAAYLPYLALAAVLLSILAAKFRKPVFDWRFFVLGAAVAIVALLSTDPEFPAKRIHVAQYLVLALLLYSALSRDLPRGRYLCLAAAVMGTLYGIHDELLQGFHPDRTFGVRDIGINILGAVSGALIAGAFVPPGKDPSGASAAHPDRSGTIAILTIVAGAGLLVLPLEGYRDQFIPAWTALPLLAAGLCTALLAPASFAGSLSFRVFAFAAFSLLLYPLASHVPTLRFH
ncbi:MAG: VanZ family protein [Alphaproteobacteria bacterium]